jgi:hypothetical protein
VKTRNQRAKNPRITESKKKKKKNNKNFVHLDASIQAEVVVHLLTEVILHNVHDGGHLEEHEDLVAGHHELGQDAIQELKLARDAEEQVGGDGTVLQERILHMPEHKGVVAGLAKLHDRVVEVQRLELFPVSVVANKGAQEKKKKNKVSEIYGNPPPVPSHSHSQRTLHPYE